MTALQAPTQTATITIDATREIGRIDPLIYGHFLESNFFGNIEGGIFDEGSDRSNPAGLRQDVIEQCRRLGVPIVRWPGGNFTSAYHWEDGIGPRAARPRRLDLTWGGEESNRFGTDEFLAWCGEVGAEPYLVHSARNVDEAVRWVEYTNYAGDTFYTRARAANGRPAPYRVRYWGVGNEVYGPWQMGHRTAEQYAADAREHAQFMRAVDPDLQLIAVGAPDEDWMRPLLSRAGGFFDYVSLHLYAASTHLAGDDEFDAVVGQSLYFEQEIGAFSDLVESIAGAAGIDRPLSIALDEWNIRHLEPASWSEPEPGADGGVAERDLTGLASAELRVNRWSPRTLADALFYAGVFHGLHRLSGRSIAPRMANTVNLINANSLLAVRPNGVLASASYHVWDLYQNHLGPISVPVAVAGPTRRGAIRQGAKRVDGAFVSRDGEVPYLDAVATRDSANSMQLAVINRHPTDAVTARLALDNGEMPRRAEVFSLGADSDDLYATNTFQRPDRVALSAKGAIELADQQYSFPPHAITLLLFESR